MSKPKSLRARLTLTTAMAGALLISYGGRSSYAGSCPPVGGGAYFCSGGAVPGEAGVSIDYGGPVTVTTSSTPPAGFGIDTTGTGDTAISIKADGGLTFDDTNTYGSIITGDDDGLEAINTDGGAVTITTNGPVSGLGGDGITASNSSDGTDLTITAADVYGSQSGIKAINAGSGAISIDATGTVTGTTKYGILAENTSPSATDLTITTADVSGGQFGVRAVNLGTGALSIAATGTVTGGQFFGIGARNLGTDLTISAQGVSGGSEGILALSEGTGSLSITASGAVTGTAGYGIRAKNENGGALTITTSDPVTGVTEDGIQASNDADGTTLTISAASVTGGARGIDAENLGTGDLVITASGPVSGGSGEGINASNQGGGSLVIDADGLVSSTGDDAIRAFNAGGVVDLTISAAGVSGADGGILAQNFGTGDLSVSTSGVVTGVNGNGITANNYNGGAVFVDASDAVKSKYATGISASNGGFGTGITITAAAVSGGYIGVDAVIFAPGGIDITTNGAVSGGTGSGIRARNYAGGSLSITANDAVSSSNASGIFAQNAAGTSDLTISAAGVSGATTGVLARNYGTGDLAVTTSGMVTAGTGDGIFAFNAGTNLTISAAAVSGGGHGIYANNQGTGDLTITADGTVTSGDAEGIDAKISNVASGADITISTNDVNGGATGIAARHEGTGSIAITANGTVVGGLNGGGILARIDNDDATGAITISAAAVTGEQFGINAKNDGAGAITVTASGAVIATGLNGEGIDVDNTDKAVGDVMVSAASVDGGRYGIIAENRGAGSLYVTATGTVTGQTGDGIRAVDPAGANGLNVGVSAADVRGGNSGIFAQNVGTGFLSVTAGNVTGNSDFGIRASLINGTDLTISSADVHAGSIGIFASNNGNGSLSITAGNVTGGLGGGGNGITANLGVSGDNLTISAASVSGPDTGISARNDGTGDLSISTTGPVSGGSGYGIKASNYYGGALTIVAEDTVSMAALAGIRARNEAGATDVTIDVAGVSGAERGIDVRNFGSGDVSITATGMVTGGLRQGIIARNYNGGDLSITAEDKVSSTDWDGIVAENNDGGGGLTISAAAVSGGRSGIRAEHLGTGALSITAGGDVAGDTTEGIFALIDNVASGADLTISAMAVSGGTDGIDAENVGSGGIFVTTSGPVTGDGNGYGIRAENSGGGDVSITAADTVWAPGAGIAGRNFGPLTGNVTITAAAVSGLTGIVASSSGSGSVSVTATGTVTGTGPSSAGITAFNAAGTDIEISTVDVMGGARGISARNTGTGSTIIDADGSVTGLNDIALYAYNGVGGGDITVSAMDVQGGGFGILARSRADGSISVTASGDVTGALSDGIRADAASLNATQVTVAAQSVFGEQRGIDARNSGTGHLDVVAEGTVAGVVGEGIRARITNTASGGDLTVSAADVNGGTYGIVAENRGTGGLGITADGTVVGGTNDGIRATNTADGTHMTISAASVVGGAYGIFSNNQGTGDLSVTTEGPVTAGIGDGILAWNYNGGALSVTATDMVTSIDGEGIYTNNFAGSTSLTISAAGVSAGRYGIIGRNEGSGDFTVTASGVVASTIGAGIFAENFAGGALGITAQDDVVSTNSVGINARNLVGTTDLTIEAAGIDAGKQAINALNEGTGDLSITANGPATSGAYGGIVARNYNGGHLIVSSSDTVSAASAIGIVARNNVGGGDLTITAAGVSGDTSGIKALNYGSGSLSVSAMGPVTGTQNIGILASNVSAGSSDVTILADEVSGGIIGILSGLNGTGRLSVTATGTVTGGPASPDGSGISVIASNAGNIGMTISAASVIGGYSGIVATNFGMSDIGITTTGAVAGGDATQGVGILAKNLSDAAGDVVVSTVDVFGGVQGIETINDGIGGIAISSTGAVTGGLGAGIAAKIDNANSAGDIEISVADVSGGQSGIAVENGGKGQFFMTIDGAVAGNYGPGIGIVDINDGGGVIVIGDTGSVASNTGLAISDQDGSAVVVSRGALVDDVMLNGGADSVALIDGSATGLIGLGIENDTMQIFGVVAGGGWDDADFSGTFDGNLGQVLQIDGGDGLDTVELFGVTAASQALGVPTGLEALALSANTLVQANDADLTPFGAVFVDPSSTLQAEGNSPSYTYVGSLGNEGVVDLADGEANDVLRVSGDYAGATGSQVLLDFDADGATSDMFIIEGDVTDVSVGPFTVIHDGSLIDVNLIGEGSRTTGDGIRLIEVSGAVDGDDFALAGPVEGGIFGYELVFEDGAHFLRSDFFDQIYLYENLPGAMQTIGLALTGQLVERVGVRSAVPSALAGADGNPVAGGAPVDTAIWGRAVGLSVESEGDLDSITGTSFDQTIGFVQAGVDVTVLERQSGRLLIGALGHWGTSSLDANTFDGDDAGSANFDFYGGGLTATWYSTRGWYFDNVVQYTAYDIDISTASRFASTSTDGYAITTSHELGYRIPISETAALVPQAQLTYQHIDFDDFTDPDGVRISLDDGDSLIGRAGFAFENSAAIGSALATGYVEANVLHEFLGDNSVNVATGFGTTPISQETRGTSVELGFGGTVAVSRGVSLYAEVDYTIPFDNGVQGVQALGGIRVNLNPPPAPPLPAPVIAPVAETAFIVFFDWDRAELTSEANLVLDEVAVVANETGYASIRLDGYTDLSGSAAYNLGLSERRANSVANGLIARGIAPDEIVIRAFGEENPLVPTPDGVREPQNRRVEIFLS